jgi:hypothetical protein
MRLEKEIQARNMVFYKPFPSAKATESQMMMARQSLNSYSLNLIFQGLGAFSVILLPKKIRFGVPLAISAILLGYNASRF